MGNEVVPFKKNRDWQFYAEKISTAWQKATHSIIETGQCLIEAKAELDYGEFESMVQLKLPFDTSTAQRLMAIARHPVLSKPAHGQVLPPSWRTLYELTKLPEATLRAKIADHSINPKMERRDAVALRKHRKDNPKRGPKPPRIVTLKSTDAPKEAARTLRENLGIAWCVQLCDELQEIIKANTITTVKFNQPH